MLKFAGGVGRVGLARLGTRFPGLEPRPPLTPLTDPSNSGPNASPAQQEAAAVKADQDAAPQKAKGIAFLGQIGCLQYYPDTAKSLLAALDDPVEMVRFAAAKALRTANGRPCAVCKSSSCCSREVIEKLQDIGYMTRDDGCWKEPSARVRRMARLAVQGCGCIPVMDGEGGNLPIEGPLEEPPVEPAVEPPAEPAAPAGGAEGEPPPEELTKQAVPNSLKDATAVRKASATVDISPDQATIRRGRLLATVDGAPIYESHIQDAVQRRIERARQAGDLESAEQLREKALLLELDQEIDRVLLAQAAKRSQATEEASSAEGDSPNESQPGDAGEAQVAPAEWLSEQLEFDRDISAAEIWDYYQRHSADLQTSAYARWEELTLPFKPGVDPARARLVMEALRARMSGKTDGEVPIARAKIEAKVVDWTSLDELASDSLRGLLTSLPLEQISPVCEDEAGVHLFRVLERRPARTIPLSEASDSIRAELLRRRRATARKEFLQKLRADAEVTLLTESPTTTKPRLPQHEEQRSANNLPHPRRPASFAPRTRAEFLRQGAASEAPTESRIVGASETMLR